MAIINGIDLPTGIFGNDVVNTASGGIHGTSSNNTVNGSNGNDVPLNGISRNIVNGGSGNDVLLASDGNNYINGSDGNDVLLGGNANDTLVGGLGDDTLVGGAGTDILIGGQGNDVFKFSSVSDSLPVARDLIADFVGNGNLPGDRIDLSDIDANSTIGGKQNFAFIGAAAFTAPGQVRYLDGILQANTDGNLSADFEVRLIGAPPVVANNIIL
ncbi:MAG: M10 family metallopeptidase C-terminal domain-containing protein [Nostoc sp.]|uniref:calcium-binding protein n=1 Tax=Nostoc sp. TaxID=1180 RepID=UPI002FF719C4